MDEDEKKETLLEQEAAAIKFFKENAPSNPKKLKQMARRLWDNYPKQIQEGLLARIIGSSDPVAMLRHITETVEEWYDIVPGFIASGYHGIIIQELDSGKKNPDGRHSNKAVYGFHIKTIEKWLTERIPWNKEQEKEIQLEVLSNWMEDEGVKDFTGKVVCFENYGFSGEPGPYHIVDGKDSLKEANKPLRSDAGKYRRGLR